MGNSLDRLIATFCSPTLAGVKPSSLMAGETARFPDLFAQLQTYQYAFAARGLCFEILYMCHERFLLFVYHRKHLEQQLSCLQNQQLLSLLGYPTGKGLMPILYSLKQRVKQGGSFPHEIGIFLGYPIEDVLGFILHQGRDCKLCGYWKVYGDVEAACKQFDRLSRIRRAVIRRIDQGESLLEVFATA